MADRRQEIAATRAAYKNSPSVLKLCDVAEHALSEPERIAQAERRGAEAMREAAAKWLVDGAKMQDEAAKFLGREGNLSERDSCQSLARAHRETATAIRALPLPDAPAEVDRIEAARRDGEAAGIERAARWHEGTADMHAALILDLEREDERARIAAMEEAEHRQNADAIRSLTPAPAEPSAPAAPQSRAELEAIREARIAAREEEVAKLREGLKDVLASLVATVSLLGRIPNARLAAPSNKMFEQMMLDYEATIERARARLQGQGGDDGKTV